MSKPRGHASLRHQQEQAIRTSALLPILVLCASLCHPCPAADSMLSYPAHTRADLAASSSPFKFPVCWTSTGNGGFLPVESQQPQFGVPGVAVFGSGCSHCAAGAACSFSVTIAPPASWVAPTSHPQWREIKVLLEGPARHAGLVESTDPGDTGFLVTYRIWDVGTYRVSLRAPCGTLNYTSNPEQNRPHEVASWTLTVHSPDAVISYPKERYSADEGATERVSLPNGLVSPCVVSKYGRWLLQEDESYKWTPFSCLKSIETSPSEWIVALNQRGIYEISFVGDSHQRNLMLHMRSLLTDGEVDSEHSGAHSSFSYTWAIVGRGRLTLNFFWMSGIYISQDQFGCNMDDRTQREPEYPRVPTSLDALVIEAGYWAGLQCTHPEAALATHFSTFLVWARQQVDAAAENVTRLENGGRREPLLVYRPTPPRASEGSGCSKKLTNKYIQDANAIEKVLVPLFGAHEFDSWEIEAAGQREDCGAINQEHFSCIVEETVRERRRQRIFGGIGEADVQSLVHLLLNN